MTATHDDAHATGHDHAHDAGHDDAHGHAHDTGGHDTGHAHDTGHRTPPRGAPGRAAASKSTAGKSTGHAAGHGAHAAGDVSAAWLRGTAAVATLALVLLPFFHVIYRLTLFEPLPHEDYARFLLSLLGQPGGAVPGAPYGYRGLAVLAAAPFYFGLPALPLANAPAGMPAELLRATAALALLTHLCLAGTLYATYRLARDRCGQDAATALLAAALLFVLSWYGAFCALDPLAILLVTLGLYLLRHRQGFTLLLLATPVVSENIAVVFAVWLSWRCATARARSTS